MLFEHMQMSLADFICKLNQNKMKIPGKTIKTIFKQIVKGVDYMHKNMTFHRDLKTSNILINPKELLVKICDLGLARHFNVPFDTYDNHIGNFCLLKPQTDFNFYKVFLLIYYHESIRYLTFISLTSGFCSFFNLKFYFKF